MARAGSSAWKEVSRVDTRLVTAGAVAALGLVLLVPTFNALNASYVQDVPPPPWMPTPPTPPDMTPPTNFKPPPDMTPPTNWKGETPPNCPPPVLVRLKESNHTESFSPGPTTASGTWTRAWDFEAPDGTIVVGGYVNWTNWQAQSVSSRLSGPERDWSWPMSNESTSTGLVTQSTPLSVQEYNSYELNDNQPVAGGTWRIEVRAELPIGGTVATTFAALLPCGGLLSQ
jgi:hypothetical protein